MNINVNMNGAEYIRYKESERKRFKIDPKNYAGIGWIIGSLLLGFSVIPYLLHTLNPPTPIPPIVWGTTTILGVVISNQLLTILVVCAGLSWVFHGFGFILVRR